MKPHLRTPGYIFGAKGVIERVCGSFLNPELLAYRKPDKKQILYRVRFKQAELWEHYEGSLDDTIDVEIYDHWLSKNPTVNNPNDARIHVSQGVFKSECPLGGHDHKHLSRAETEQIAVDLECAEPPQVFSALKQLCLDKGLISAEDLHRAVERTESMGQNMEGPRIVAKAWMDSQFKEALLSDANSALKEIGLEASNNTASTVLTVVENTPEVHNLIVCTLCSCYPRSILGLSPSWYRSRSYRARAVREPRKVLKEFGLEISSAKSVRVHDSTADLRYFVLPEKPSNVADLSEEEIMKLISRDHLIGTAA